MVISVIKSFCVANSDCKNKPLEKFLLRLTAFNGLPFSIFCRSVDIRKASFANGYNELLKSAYILGKLAVDFSKTVRGSLKN